MLKVNRIDFTDQENRVYSIYNNQIENFPFAGGSTSNMIKTKAWNQHGNTFITSYMESFEGDLVFALYTANKSLDEIAEMRKEVATICNPLNGKIEMSVEFNNGDFYNREITFVSAPIFPIGHDNRNDVWQKVQLLYEANNPFWYSDRTITESFEQAIPLFEFPFEMTTAKIEFGSYIPSKTIVNEGQVDAPITIRIVGSCINPTIANLTTNELIRFKNLTMGANDVLEISTTFGEKKALLNGNNVFYALDFSSTFFSLKLGENEIDFRDDTLVKPLAKISFTYRNLYHTI